MPFASRPAAAPLLRRSHSVGGLPPVLKQEEADNDHPLAVSNHRRQNRRSSSSGAVEIQLKAAPTSVVQAAAAGATCLEELPVVLFLDVDGVLHPTTVRHPRQQFQRSCMALLFEILAATGACIVLSTSWRLHSGARKELAGKLREHGIPSFVSCTPNLAQFHRAKEILAWVRKYRPAAWVSLDDWPLLEENLPGMHGHFVQTRPRYGLLPETAAQVIETFRSQMG